MLFETLNSLLQSDYVKILFVYDWPVVLPLAVNPTFPEWWNKSKKPSLPQVAVVFTTAINSKPGQALCFI